MLLEEVEGPESAYGNHPELKMALTKIEFKVLLDNTLPGNQEKFIQQLIYFLNASTTTQCYTFSSRSINYIRKIELILGLVRIHDIPFINYNELKIGRILT